jgi:hypothetical protein
MRHNAKKITIPSASSQNSQIINKPTPSFETFVKHPQKSTYQQTPMQTQRSANYNPRLTPLPPQARNNQPFGQKPSQTQPQTSPVTQKPQSQSHDTPPDWLKPKIYKGSTLL